MVRYFPGQIAWVVGLLVSFAFSPSIVHSATRTSEQPLFVNIWVQSSVQYANNSYRQEVVHHLSPDSEYLLVIEISKTAYQYANVATATLPYLQTRITDLPGKAAGLEIDAILEPDESFVTVLDPFQKTSLNASRSTDFEGQGTIEHNVQASKIARYLFQVKSTNSAGSFENRIWLNDAQERTLEALDLVLCVDKELPEKSQCSSPAILPSSTRAAPPQLPNYVEVPIFYATDRQAIFDTVATRVKYSGRRGTLQIGMCVVTLPRDHRMGIIERPDIWRLEFREDPEKHVILREISVMDGGKYFKTLQEHLSKSKNKEAFVFIHGYHVTFDEAARRTAQIYYDLKFDGAAILYSWPSQGTYKGYPNDENNIEWTAVHLKQYLEELAAKSGARVIHLIAHSMGNRALTWAIKDIVNGTKDSHSLPVFDQVVLTAPDIDAAVFETLTGYLRKAAKRITLYVSANDKALLASKEFHGEARAGDSAKNIVVLPGIDTIDASLVDTSLVGHSYYGDSRSVIYDLAGLIRDRRPPQERLNLLPRTLHSLRYWVFQP